MSAPPALGVRVFQQLALERLGGAEAPVLLRDRVMQQFALETLAGKQAPAVLWEQVEPQVQRIAAQGGRPAPVFAFPRESVRRLAIAAALLMAVGTGMLAAARPAAPSGGLDPLAMG
ncbi:MAG TPA: hypothetical protein VGC54_01420, partial [Planctomycetota bacterium]